MNDSQKKIMDSIKVGGKSGCWLWQKAKSNGGYGVAAVGRKTMSAHRAAYIAFRGPIPKGLEMDHLCQTKACVNPYHVEPVTKQEHAHRTASYKEVCDGIRIQRRITIPKGNSSRLNVVSVRLTNGQLNEARQGAGGVCPVSQFLREMIEVGLASKRTKEKNNGNGNSM